MPSSPAAPSSATSSPSSSSEGPSIPLSGPDLSDLERDYVAQVLDSDRLALGPWMERFEAAMAHRCDTEHAVAVSSGTAALHCVVRALGLGPGDEVITTPYSFVASSNVLLFEGVTPRFVDVDPTTYNIDLNAAEAAVTPATRAILAVDVFGTPADWPGLTRLAEAHNLDLIDDACEALGASVNGTPLGAWGRAGSFGFYPNKQITTGEGGCITTNDADLAAACRSLRNQGRADDGRMEHVRLGYNYRLDEMSAALGCAQLERLDDILARRRQAAAAYQEALAPLSDHLALPGAPATGRRSWFVYVVRLRNGHPASLRNRLLSRLQAAGIGCAPYFPAIHLQPYYRDRFGFAEGDFPICESVAARTFALPFFSSITRNQIDRVATVLENALADLTGRE